MTRWLDAAKIWARQVKRDVIAVWIAARDARTPFLARALAICVAAYALSPIDLIPDFIPVLGYLDDLLIVPLGIMAVIRLVPRELFAQFRTEAAAVAQKPVSKAGLAVIVLIWAVCALIVWNWIMGLV
ncbi:YkvA family protein [Devosia sp. XJ19-1]|uniref:YkvA family protein n=1 Tax=Devosia ureilytica TaxID=2952754 RepID=A0A9Q4FQ78_9HYPH|nr:YkvA family protein [Devosia ureilytica]MCP8885591.1 YkvA family protein [Devosia ureilytica]